MKIDQEVFERIGKEIHSDASPVGIDAKKTHIMILAKLEALAAEMEVIKKKLDSLS